MSNSKVDSRLRVLVELRPCSHGFSGIPQETRLLYSMFAGMAQLQVGGLLNSFYDLRVNRRLIDEVSGRSKRSAGDRARQLVAQARFLGRVDQEIHGVRTKNTFLTKLGRRVRGKGARLWGLSAILRRDDDCDLVELDATSFEDFVWTRFFERTLTSGERAKVLGTQFFGFRRGWMEASETCKKDSATVRVNTAGWDVFLSQVFCPFNPAPETRAVVRYHDAIPIFLPHTLPSIQAIRLHANGLRASVRNRALFVCTSEPVREDLLKLYPTIEVDTEIVPDVVSSEFHPKPEAASVVTEILRRRRCEATWRRSSEVNPHDASGSLRRRGAMPRRGENALTRLSAGFVLAVSTLEPRKNYKRLLQAWIQARRRLQGDPLLVVVANLGWRNAEEVAELTQLVEEGHVAHLSGVPLEELRILYSNAKAVVCPSRQEGFDLSGIEAMMCGAPVIASNIKVHRWVYGDAAVYFDPYDAESLAQVLVEVVSSPSDDGFLAELRARGVARAKLYTHDSIAPKWAAVFDRLAAEKAQRTSPRRY